MGTKIQSNRYPSGYCSSWGLNESMNNDILSLYHGSKALKNAQHYDPVLPQQKLKMGGHRGYDLLKVRQMILEHESTFRHQLQELHRLYGRQKEIMNELKRREVTNGQMVRETSHFSSFPPRTSSNETKPTWHVSHTSLLHSLLDQASAFQNSSHPSFRKGKTMLNPFPSRDEGSSEGCEPPNSNSKLLRNRMFDLEKPADVYIDDEEKKIETNFCGLPGIGSVSNTRIDEIPHKKDVNFQQEGGALWSNSCSKRNNQLTDLNEPIPLEENFVPAILGTFGNVSSTDIGQQLTSDFTSVMSNDAHPSFRDACSKASHAELKRNELSASDQGKAKHQRKRKLFGVDIFEVDDRLLGADPPMDSSNLTSDNRATALLPRFSRQEALPKSLDDLASLNWKSAKVSKTANKLSNVIQDVLASEYEIVRADCQGEKNDLKESLLCTADGYHGKQTKTIENSHHLNIGSLKDSSWQFFQKGRTTLFSLEMSVQKQEAAASHFVQETEQRNITVAGGSNAELTNHFPVSNSKELSSASISAKEIYFGAESNNSEHVLVEKVFSKEAPKAGDIDLEARISGFQEQIDLNLSLVEDEALSAPSLPSAIVKVARTEIDLEAPPTVLQAEAAEGETNSSRDGPHEPSDELLLKNAAEAIVAIAISSSSSNLATAEPLEAAATGHLGWLAELACSFKFDDQSLASELTADGVFTEEMIPEGMDYFEFMTLRLKDTKEENYHYRPLIMENEDDGCEEIKLPTSSRKPRRGQARKGRQRKDFQRDVLPAIITLSKREVVEDFQTLEALFKCNGCEWQARLLRKASGKGRQRKSLNSGVSTPPQESEAIGCSIQQQPLSKDLHVGENMLCGWGKRTRRLPRQRYINGSLAFQSKPLIK